ncbi:MAG: NAD-dependent epimerase/dehydratase family protein [Bacteroidota bacterium]
MKQARKNKRLNILVTGGGGFIGMALVRRLVKQGYHVSTFSRSIYEEHKKLGVKTYQGNIINFSDIEKACAGIDVVFHVASKAGIWGAYKDFYRVNVTGTENVINACKLNKVKKLIFTSSASVIFDGTDLEGVDETINYPEKPVSNYTATKAEAEQLVLQANSTTLNTISLRPHLVWGPGDTQLIPKILKRAKSGRLKKIGRKEFLIDTTYIDNLIDAQMLAMEKPVNGQEISGKAFFITNGEPVPAWNFLNSIIKAAWLPPVEKTISKKIALIVAGILEKLHLIFRLKKEPFITRFVIHELCTHHWFDISAAKRLLDYSPKVSFENGIKNLKIH